MRGCLACSGCVSKPGARTAQQVGRLNDSASKAVTCASLGSRVGPGGATCARGRALTRPRSSRLLHQAQVAKRGDGLVADDDMVEEFDAEDVAALDEAPRQLDVGTARSRVAARVIVGDDD